MSRFFYKKNQNKKLYPQYLKPQLLCDGNNEDTVNITNAKLNVEDNTLVVQEIISENKKQSKENMDTREKILMAKEVLQQTSTVPKVKKVGKDKGLIEKTESSKIILTEDNRELLND